ncbi:hypothetical protein [Microbacterium sp. 69-10]|uniref:hypothetical protein n=1 Tax=Microbacterium sp. 69-10 TaxID=1895783 RepID=UPI0025EDB925|nr:hypothetical protein [Microbacterium sp. 69-10]
MSTHARPLADRLAAVSDARLAELLRSRGVRPDAEWSDFFDAAEALLEPGSIERGLAALTRAEARSLMAAVAGEADAGELTMLAERGLVDDGGRVPAPVAVAVTAHPPVPELDPVEEVPGRVGPRRRARVHDRGRAGRPAAGRQDHAAGAGRHRRAERHGEAQVRPRR